MPDDPADLTLELGPRSRRNRHTAQQTTQEYVRREFVEPVQGDFVNDRGPLERRLADDRTDAAGYVVAALPDGAEQLSDDFAACMERLRTSAGETAASVARIGRAISELTHTEGYRRMRDLMEALAPVVPDQRNDVLRVARDVAAVSGSSVADTVRSLVQCLDGAMSPYPYRSMFTEAETREFMRGVLPEAELRRQLGIGQGEPDTVPVYFTHEYVIAAEDAARIRADLAAPPAPQQLTAVVCGNRRQFLEWCRDNGVDRNDRRYRVIVSEDQARGYEFTAVVVVSPCSRELCEVVETRLVDPVTGRRIHGRRETWQDVAWQAGNEGSSTPVWAHSQLDDREQVMAWQRPEGGYELLLDRNRTAQDWAAPAQSDRLPRPEWRPEQEDAEGYVRWHGDSGNASEFYVQDIPLAGERPVW